MDMVMGLFSTTTRNLKQEAIVEATFRCCVDIIHEGDINKKLSMWTHLLDGVIYKLQVDPQLLRSLGGLLPAKREILNAISTLLSQQR